MAELEWTTAGESHGRALVAVLHGLPSGLALDVGAIDAFLARRQSGYGRSARQALERDRAEVLAGLRAGSTLGSPLCLAIENRDASIDDLPVPDDPRPGHADLAGCHKHGVRDPRLVMERASARETAARTALGAVAAQLLARFGIEVFAHVREIGGVAVRADAWESAGEGRAALRAASAFAALDPAAEDALRARVDAAREGGDSLGGVFEVRALGLPPGLGGYADPRERLTSRIGAALFSIPAIKGVERGLGFEAARRPGSEVHDAIVPGRGPGGRFARASNRSGGLEGGMTNGEQLVVRAAMKPIPTLRRGLPSVAFSSGAVVRATYQRSDLTAVPAASAVGEALVALELARALRSKLGGDSLAQMSAAWRAWKAEIEAL
jgi:chorismate synthase